MTPRHSISPLAYFLIVAIALMWNSCGRRRTSPAMTGGSRKGVRTLWNSGGLPNFQYNETAIGEEIRHAPWKSGAEP